MQGTFTFAQRWTTRSRLIALATVLVVVTCATTAVVLRNVKKTKLPATIDDVLEQLNQGSPEAAFRMFRDSQLQGDEQQAALLRGALLVKKGYSYPALEELSGPATDKRLSKWANCFIGEAWYQLGRHVEAQAAWQKALASDNDFLEANRWLAASYYDQSAIHDAIVYLKRTAELAPRDHRPYRLLGLIYKDFERYEDAIPCYEETLQRKSDQPDYVEVREELAECQLKMRRYTDAFKTLQICPDTAAVNALRAECHYGVGEIVLAKRAAQVVLNADPKNLSARLLQGTMFLEDGNARAAAESFKLAAADHPKDYIAHFKLAQAYAALDEQGLAAASRELAEQIRKTREEFAQLHQVARDQPGNAQVRLRLAELAGQLERPDLAEVWVRSAAALQPQQDSTQSTDIQSKR